MNFLWLIKTESYKRGMLLSVIFNIISKGILFLLTILIARFFGSNIKTDIYFFVYGSMVLFAGFINTIDTMVLIPESMRLREKQGNDIATGFLNFFFRLYFFIGIVFVALMFFFGTTIFGFISKFSETDILTYKNYFLLGSLYFLFMILTNYINTILTSLKFFTIPMIISGINSCIVIAGILLLHRQFDVLSVFWGGIAACSINLVLLLIVMKKKAGWNFSDRSSGIKKKVWSNICFAELGQLATLASSLFPLYLLSGFGSGVISVMNYGKNIADIPNTLVTAQLANVSGIQLNEQAARNDGSGMNTTFLSTSKYLIFILVPVGFFMFVFAGPIVEIVYKRGSFDVASVESAAIFMKLLAVTVFSIAVNTMVSRVFIAMQAVKQAFIYQVIMNVFLIIAIWLFVGYFGAYGYGYAVITMSVINFIGLHFMCRIIAPQVNYAALARYTIGIILLNGAIAAAFYYGASYLQINMVCKLVVLLVVWSLILALLNKLFHLDFNIAPGLKNKQ